MVIGSRLHFAPTALAIGLSALLVACSSNGPASGQPTTAPAASAPSLAPSGSDGGVAEATRIVEQLTKPVEWTAPGPQLPVGNTLSGKSVYFVGNLKYEYDLTLLEGVTAAAEALGMKVTGLDANAQAGTAAAMIEQAIGQKADVIINQGYPEAAIEAPLRAAKEAGIPVIGSGVGVPQLPPADVQELGVPGWATFCYKCMGTYLADWIIADSKGQANVVTLQSSDLSVSPAFVAGIDEEFSRLCPSCGKKTVDVILARWTSSLGSAATSALQADPTVNYVIALYDPMVPLILPPILGMGADSRVKIVTAGASGAGLQLLASEEVVRVNLGSSKKWLGWALMDQAVRALTDAPALADAKVPNRLFTKENVGELDLTKNDDWYGDIDFGANYRALWGIQ
jgi:ribose transport system substrate-binding protein